MRINDLESGVGRMAHALAKLKERWADVKEHWRDDNARRFEQLMLQPLPTKLNMLVSAAQRLAETLDIASRELDDRPNDG